jgi:hypothetical protein
MNTLRARYDPIIRLAATETVGGADPGGEFVGSGLVGGQVGGGVHGLGAPSPAPPGACGHRVGATVTWIA